MKPSPDVVMFAWLAMVVPPYRRYQRRLRRHYRGTVAASTGHPHHRYRRSLMKDCCSRGRVTTGTAGARRCAAITARARSTLAAGSAGPVSTNASDKSAVRPAPDVVISPGTRWECCRRYHQCLCRLHRHPRRAVAAGAAVIALATVTAVAMALPPPEVGGVGAVAVAVALASPPAAPAPTLSAVAARRIAAGAASTAGSGSTRAIGKNSMRTSA